MSTFPTLQSWITYSGEKHRLLNSKQRNERIALEDKQRKQRKTLATELEQEIPDNIKEKLQRQMDKRQNYTFHPRTSWHK